MIIFFDIVLYSVVDVQQLDQILHQMVSPLLRWVGWGDRGEEGGNWRGGGGSPGRWRNPGWSKWCHRRALGPWSPCWPGRWISQRWRGGSWVCFRHVHSWEALSCSWWGRERCSHHGQTRWGASDAFHAQRGTCCFQALPDVVLGTPFQGVALSENRRIKTCFVWKKVEIFYCFGIFYLYERQISASCVCFLKWWFEALKISDQICVTWVGLGYMDSASLYLYLYLYLCLYLCYLSRSGLYGQCFTVCASCPVFWQIGHLGN